VTLVFERPDAQPGTHVLVIGVGLYDHLIDGPERLLDNPFGLGQLGSPPRSAKRFAEWMLAELNNADAPLASVEVLISSLDPTSINVPGEASRVVETATRKHIQTAFDDWFARANADPRNVAVFYHCGHGLVSTDLSLLAQDFGSPGGGPTRLWANAYNFERTHLGMRRCKADAQFFFIDTCRQISADLLVFDGKDTDALIEPNLRHTNNNRNAPILYAAARDSEAFAKSNEVSRFTDAVLAAVSGNGASKVGGQWKVSNESLPSAVIKRIRRGNDKPGVPVQISTISGESSGTSFLHVLKSAPAVPTFLRCDSAEPFPQTARLEFLHNQNVAAQYPGPGPWELEISASIYEVRAMNESDVIGTDADGWIIPPEYEGTVE